MGRVADQLELADKYAHKAREYRNQAYKAVVCTTSSGEPNARRLSEVRGAGAQLGQTLA